MNNGYFNENEYVITNMKPRRLLYNYLWNEELVCQCDHFGNGSAWRNLGTQQRDIERGSRNVYIRNNDSKEFYSANRNYDDLHFDVHECHIGLGYQTIVSEYKEIRVEYTILVPTKGAVVLYCLKVKNVGKTAKDISAYYTTSPRPDLSWHAAYGYSESDKELNGLVFNHDGFRLPNDYTKVFIACDKKYDAYEVSGNRFYGEYCGERNPISLKDEKLSSIGSNFDMHIAAFQFNLSLKENEEFEVCFCAASARSKEECLAIKKQFLTDGAFEQEKQKQIELNTSYQDVFRLSSPDNYLNRQINVWLKRQISLGKTWGRLYGKGFRDVMQDIASFVSLDPALARRRILHALTYQYEDGNPIRMFEPNFRYPYNDGGVWITGAILSYLNETADFSIINEELTYLKGDSYENSSLADAFVSEPYIPGKRKDSVLEHVKAAIDYLLNCRGKRNLVLWRGGDWNDSLNNAGLKNKGESVWLSIATVKAIQEFIEILSLLKNKEDLIEQYKKAKNELNFAIQKYGKYEDYYIYGINDEEEVIGGKDRIFLNPQSWAVLANLESKDKLEKVMDVVEEKLKCNFGYVQCNPSFNEGKESIGRISYFKPGLVENGGVYNHGVAFKIVADCMLGRGDNAYESLKLISCDNPKNPNSGVEPYAVCNMYIGPENPYNVGFAPMNWITGTAGWIYRAVTEYICGIKATPNGLMINPCLPSNWNDISIVRKFRGATYNIVIKRSNRKGIFVDDKKIEKCFLPIASSGSTINCMVLI